MVIPAQGPHGPGQGRSVLTVPSADFSITSETCNTLQSEGQDTQSCVLQWQKSQENQQKTQGEWQSLASVFEPDPVSAATQNTQALGALLQHSRSQALGFWELAVYPTGKQQAPFLRGISTSDQTRLQEAASSRSPRPCEVPDTERQGGFWAHVSLKPARFSARHRPTPVSTCRNQSPKCTGLQAPNAQLPPAMPLPAGGGM